MVGVSVFFVTFLVLFVWTKRLFASFLILSVILPSLMLITMMVDKSTIMKSVKMSILYPLFKSFFSFCYFCVMLCASNLACTIAESSESKELPNISGSSLLANNRLYDDDIIKL